MINHRRYERLLESVFDEVYFVDNERRITYWNKAAEDLTGFRRDEVIGTRCSDNLLRHVDDHGCHLCIEGCPLAAVKSTGRNRVVLSE